MVFGSTGIPRNEERTARRWRFARSATSTFPSSKPTTSKPRRAFLECSQRAELGLGELIEPRAVRPTESAPPAREIKPSRSAAPHGRRQGRPPKTELTRRTVPEPARVLETVANIYCTPKLLTDPTAAVSIATARALAVSILRRDCNLPPSEIARLFHADEEQVYAALGRAQVLFETGKDFARALSEIRTKL